MKPPCDFCKQNDCRNSDLCKQFYLYLLNEKIKKLRELLNMLTEQVNKLN